MKVSKELFVATINAMYRQYVIDCDFSDNMGKAFPDCYSANMLPNNGTVCGALLDLLRDVSGDVVTDNDSGWIS